MKQEAETLATLAPGSDLEFLLRAVAFAAHKHRDHRRKDADATPYINHPISVAELLARMGGVRDPVTLAAAILHDTVEDTCTKPEELEEHFGTLVRSVVMEVTDDKLLEKAERKRLQVEHAPSLSTRARLVKYGDKICNVIDITERPPSDWPVDRRREYLVWVKSVIDQCRGANPALEKFFDETLDKAARSLA